LMGLRWWSLITCSEDWIASPDGVVRASGEDRVGGDRGPDRAQTGPHRAGDRPHRLSPRRGSAGDAAGDCAGPVERRPADAADRRGRRDWRPADRGAGGGGHGVADRVGDAGGGLCLARLRPDRRRRVQSTRVGPDHRADQQGRHGAGAGRARRARSDAGDLHALPETGDRTRLPNHDRSGLLRAPDPAGRVGAGAV